MLDGGETGSRAPSASSTRPATPPTTSATSTTDSGWAFVGDMAGVVVPPNPYTLAPTPPPDIDVEEWERSLETIAGLGAQGARR